MHGDINLHALVLKRIFTDYLQSFALNQILALSTFP